MMSTPKPLHDTSADRSTKVMGLALRDVNESLAGSLGIAEGTSEYMNLTSSVSDTVENFIGDGSAINIKLTEELFKLTSEVKNTIKTLLKKPTDVEEISGLSPVMKATLGEEEKRTLAGAKKIIADMMTADEEMESFTASSLCCARGYHPGCYRCRRCPLRRRCPCHCLRGGLRI